MPIFLQKIHLCRLKNLIYTIHPMITAKVLTTAEWPEGRFEYFLQSVNNPSAKLGCRTPNEATTLKFMILIPPFYRCVCSVLPTEWQQKLRLLHRVPRNIFLYMQLPLFPLCFRSSVSLPVMYQYSY